MRHYNGAFLRNLLRSNSNFKKFWRRATKDQRGYLIHVEFPEKVIKNQSGNIHLRLMDRTQSAFNFILKQGCDTIYWMADYNDKLDPGIAEETFRRLRRNDVKVLLHDFDGGNQLTENNKNAKIKMFICR